LYTLNRPEIAKIRDMDIDLRDPELNAYVDECVRSGQFPDASAVVEAAVRLLRDYEDDAVAEVVDEEDLDSETLSAIREGLADAAAGRVKSIEEIASKYGVKLGTRE
jgi:putative addiction module CopG family antidote